MKKISIIILMAILICLIFPTTANADFEGISVNIYVNDQFAAADTVSLEDCPELEYGNFPADAWYGDAYGTFVRSSCSINGYQGITFDFDAPSTIVFMTSSYEIPLTGVVLNLYYTQEEEVTIEYGSVIVRVFTNLGNPVANADVTIYGKKGADQVEYTFTSDKNGIAQIDNLDLSYTWQVSFQDQIYPTFFENNICTMDMSVYEGEIETPPIVEGNEHTITLTYEYKNEHGGTLTDGHSDEAFGSKIISFTAISGEQVDLTPYAENPPGAEFIEYGDEGLKICFNNNYYTLGTIYKTINGGHSESPLIFTMEDKDVDITLVYTYVGSKEVIKEIEVPVPTEIIKEVEVPVPTEVVKEVIKTVPVPVTKETTQIIHSDPIILSLPNIRATIHSSVELEKIDDEETPLTEPVVVTGWSLINLILMLSTMLGLLKLNNRKYNPLNILFAISAVLIFAFLEDTTQKVILINEYTPLMAVIFLCQFLSKILSPKEIEEAKEDKDKKEESTN